MRFDHGNTYWNRFTVTSCSLSNFSQAEWKRLPRLILVPGDAEEWSVERIATKLAGMWGSGASWTRDSNPSVHEAQSLHLDSAKAHSILGWQPRLKIEMAVEWTLNWYRAYSDVSNMLDLTMQQLDAYERLAS